MPKKMILELRKSKKAFLAREEALNKRKFFLRINTDGSQMKNEILEISQELLLNDNESDSLKSLRIIDDHFKILANKFNNNSSKLHNFNALLNYLLINAIDNGISEGMSKMDIRDSLPFTYTLFSQSQFINHIQNWPLGYPGDYQIVNMMIDRTTSTKYNTFEKSIEDFYLNSPISQQHREKINKQSNLIKKVCLKKEKANIISLACGPCRDIENTQEIIKIKNANILLIDSDNNSLLDAKARLKMIEAQISFLPIDILNMRKSINEFSKKNGKIDLVYAGGLFDYLPKKTINFILKQIKDIMNDDGLVFFTNIKNGNPFKNTIEVMGNWSLIERDIDEINELCQMIGFENVVIEEDKTKLTWLVECTK